MRKRFFKLMCAVTATALLTGCVPAKKAVNIGVSFGAGPAARWPIEKAYMEEHARNLGINLNVRFNTTDKPKTQTEDCFELINSGISVLIIMPRNIYAMKDIIDYAKENKVKVVSYSRIIYGEPIDLYIGYDSMRIGQAMGQYLSETVYQGDYILLKGDPNDHNAELLHDGAMRYIEPIKKDINIILEAEVPGWSPEEAKKLVLQALKKNGNTVDAILAPNDKLAGACVEALEEAGVKKHVVITGMDAELDAVRRIVNGTQDITIFMDLKDLSISAIDQAYNLATKNKATINAEISNDSGKPIPSHLITGKLITAQNIDKIVLDGGIFTREEIYGTK